MEVHGCQVRKIYYLTATRQYIFNTWLIRASVCCNYFHVFKKKKKKGYVFEDDFKILNKLLIVNFCGVFSAFAVDKLSENVQQTKLYRK